MTSSSIIVAALDERLETAAQIARRLAAAWTHGPAPPIDVACGLSLEADQIESLDAVILVADPHTDEAAALTLLSMLEESSIPVVALLDDTPAPGNCFEFAAALVKRIDADDAMLAATIRALTHRQQEVRRLRQEVALAHRFQGGLRGQMAKIHEELQLAASVQREFLPKELPVLHDVAFGAMWRPSNYVSGDIYDVVRLDEDHVGMFLADAIGHGVPAALMTMVICRALEVKEITGRDYRIVPPAEVLARLNDRIVYRQATNARFVTGVYATIDCRRRVLTIAGAGHPPAMLLRTDGSTKMLETSGGLLGIFEDEEYEQIELDLEPGDRLIMYSDGFELVFPDPPAADGKTRPMSNRYLDEFRSLRETRDASAMIHAIARRMDDQQGSLHQRDDVTMLCAVAGAACGGPVTTVPVARAS